MIFVSRKCLIWYGNIVRLHGVPNKSQASDQILFGIRKIDGLPASNAGLLYFLHLQGFGCIREGSNSWLSWLCAFPLVFSMKGRDELIPPSLLIFDIFHHIYNSITLFHLISYHIWPPSWSVTLSGVTIATLAIVMARYLAIFIFPFRDFHYFSIVFSPF